MVTFLFWRNSLHAWHRSSSLSAAICTLGGTIAPVTFAGPQGELAGLDQINIGPLPRALAGRGEVEVALTVEGKAANAVRVNFR